MDSPGTASVVAISATFTAEPVEDALRFWIDELGWPDTVRFAPFNQVFQQLLDPASLLATNRAGVNVLLVRLQDWLRSEPDWDLESLDDHARRFVAAVREASRSWHTPAFVCCCPDSAAFIARREAADAASRCRGFIERELAGSGTVHVIAENEFERLYPVADVHDPHSEELGAVPYTPLWFAALGTMLARKIHALRATPFKVIALDCDDTLWQGICGEDGAENVVIDAPRRALQESMLRQHDAGMLLCLASKNNVEDVFETFRLQSDMPLRLEHFVSHRINWDSKGHNLRSLADELQLGLDTFALVDDNPKECSEAKAACPPILALALPPRPEEIPEFLDHVWAFDRLRVTEEDRRRAILYAQQAARNRLEREAESLEDFLRSLQLVVRIRPFEPEDLARIAQLTQRTNQMNVSSARRTEAQVLDFLAGGGECVAVEVEDRFGSYGLTGAVLFQARGEALHVDTFLASCRVLGRGVEHGMLRRLGEIARERGLARVDVLFVPSPRNRPALLFLESVAGRYQEAHEGRMMFRLPADSAATVEYRPADGKPQATGGAAPRAVDVSRPDYARIARELRTPEAILFRIQTRRNGHAAPRREPKGAPQSGLERELAEIWASLLGLPVVGARDNFFDLGGHSLMAVQLLARVRDRFAVDLTLDVVYSGDFTVAELARAIELKEIERISTSGYEDLLKQVETLSDEEVRVWLEHEDAPPGSPA